ncbi:hypothetical protein PDESU_00279 [Pontiella desulfatans]|uniref:Uncharacterized protein n=1 Tax=Pontiella desulfatans TaxID=2750659 RepID=A0A6C2TVV3_PONDE|nr:hypothetical protein [Pontiella desulfatans]VGO11733.1 hypothetical protein PDESU_00279 [Pontiella desulfatans]
MRVHARSMMLPMAALLTLTASAATIELNDAQWSSMVVEAHNPYFNGSIAGTVDYPLDPGYRWDVNVVDVGGGYGLLGIGAATGTMGLAVNPGDIWSVDFTNPGTNAANYNAVTLAAYVTTAVYTGWVVRPLGDDEEKIYEGESKTLTWDLTTGDILGDAAGLSITSVQKLGLVFIGDLGGASGGAGEPFSIIVGSPSTVVLNDAQWSSMVVEPHNLYFSGSISGTTDHPRDPGYQWNVNVVDVGAGYGLLGIGADTNTLGLAINPGERWSVDFTNPGTNPPNYNGITMSAYVTTVEGHTGWVVRPMDGQESIVEGDSKTMEWDLATGEVLGGPTGLNITSVQKLGLVFIGDLGGAVSGSGGEDFAMLVGSAEAAGYNIWLAEQYPDFDTDNGKTDNPDGDALDNWNEYAFGGNPTNGADTGHPVEYGLVEAGGAFMSFIHAQRIGSDDIEYVVETTVDLVGGTWTNEGVVIAGTNGSFAADFVGVTNLVATDAGERFIRIKAVEK